MQRAFTFIGLVIACLLIIALGGTTLSMTPKWVTVACSLVLFVAAAVLRVLGRYKGSVLCFAVSIAGGFGLWLQEN